LLGVIVVLFLLIPVVAVFIVTVGAEIDLATNMPCMVLRVLRSGPNADQAASRW
jgi:hypothetical protein